LLNVFGELDQFGTFVAPLLGPGVIGNGLPDPAFMPKREAARAASSAAPGGSPFGHALLFSDGFAGPEPDAELFGVFAGNDPFGGHVGIASNGEIAPVDGIESRTVFGIDSGFGFGTKFGIVPK
jgi:hypothetical protein